MTWKPIANIIADDPYSCAVNAKTSTYMPEQQGDSSEVTRNLSTDKPRQQRGKNMDGRFQQIMHTPTTRYQEWQH